MKPTTTITTTAATSVEKFAMENCSVLESAKAEAKAAKASVSQTNGTSSCETDNLEERKYECKTCGQRFKSFQALGGHRASHNKPKLDGINGEGDVATTLKHKTHACSICGAEFAIGQALGGHMRRHRPLVPAAPTSGSTVTNEGSGEHSDGNNVGKTQILACNGEVQKEAGDEDKKRKKDDEDVLDDDEVYTMLKKLRGEQTGVDLGLGFGAWGVKKEENLQQGDVEIEEGEIVEQQEDNKVQEVQEEDDDDDDFLKLELRQPIRV